MPEPTAPLQPLEASLEVGGGENIPIFVSRDLQELLSEVARHFAAAGPFEESFAPDDPGYQRWLFSTVLTAFAQVAETRGVDLSALIIPKPSERTQQIVDYYRSPEFTVRLSHHMHSAKRKALIDRDEQPR